MNNYRQLSPDELNQFALEYCEECIESQKEVPTVKGAVRIKERRIPTYKYFILHWLKHRDIDIYSRQHIYAVMANPEHPLSDTLKNIRETFDALAEDIVANEGKGIFYAKNRLGMTDKMQEDGSRELTIKVKYERKVGDTDSAAL